MTDTRTDYCMPSAHVHRGIIITKNDSAYLKVPIVGDDYGNIFITMHMSKPLFTLEHELNPQYMNVLIHMHTMLNPC